MQLDHELLDWFQGVAEMPDLKAGWVLSLVAEDTLGLMAYQRAGMTRMAEYLDLRHRVFISCR